LEIKGGLLMKPFIRSSIFALALGLGIWTLAVTFSPIESNFQAGDEVSASAFNDLFSAINDNFNAAKAAIEANEAATSANSSAIEALSVKPAANVFLISDQSITTGGAAKTLNFGGEFFDTAALHDNTTNNSRLTAPEAGIYQVNAMVSWNANATGGRLLAVVKNGAAFPTMSDVRSPTAGGTSSQSLSGLISLAAGDFLEAKVSQDSGTTLAVASSAQTQFSMVKVSDLP
jgi:hypothetical protein